MLMFSRSTGCSDLQQCACAEHRYQISQITLLGPGHTASKPCCQLEYKEHMTGTDVSPYKYIHTYIGISPLFWSQSIEKGSMGSCSGTGKSQVVSSYSTDPQRIYKGFLPTQPQQHHC